MPILYFIKTRSIFQIKFQWVIFSKITLKITLFWKNGRFTIISFTFYLFFFFFSSQNGLNWYFTSISLINEWVFLPLLRWMFRRECNGMSIPPITIYSFLLDFGNLWIINSLSNSISINTILFLSPLQTEEGRNIRISIREIKWLVQSKWEEFKN